MKKKALNELVADKDSYDSESQNFILSLSKEQSYLSKLESMKRTEGWKLLDEKIREELQERIKILIKDDLKVQTLLALLQVADTKKQSEILEGEIEKLFPEE